MSLPPMRLPDFQRDAGLNGLRRRMGDAPMGELKLRVGGSGITEYELEQLMHEGVDLDSLNQLKILPDGTLTYKNARVLLYIRNVPVSVEPGGEMPSLPRFHVANCNTLVDMREEKRFERYVVAARTDGMFRMVLREGRVRRASNQRLKVCQNCLLRLGFDGFNSYWGRTRRMQAVEEFTTERFYARYPRDVSPEEMNAPGVVLPDKK